MYLRQEAVAQVALLVTDGRDDVLGLLRHLVEEQVDHAEAALPDVDPLLRAELVGDVGEVAADEGEGDDEAVLRRELEAHLEVVLEELRVEAEEGEAGGVRDQVLQAVHHPRMERDGVEQRRHALEGVEEAAVLTARDVALKPRPVHP